MSLRALLSRAEGVASEANAALWAAECLGLYLPESRVLWRRTAHGARRAGAA